MDEFNLDTEQTGDPVVDDRISDVEEPIVDEENDEIIGVMLRRSLVLIFFVAMVGALVYVFVIRESEPEIAITETERKVVQSRDLGAGGDAMRAAIPKSNLLMSPRIRVWHLITKMEHEERSCFPKRWGRLCFSGL